VFVPYVVGLIDLDEAVRVMATLKPGADAPGIGDRVRLSFEVVDDDLSLLRFAPVE
jgi:uncharacterized OB-fold protein